MELLPMHRVANTIVLNLPNSITSTASVISVGDVSVFPPPPNYATIGTENNAEVIFYKSVDTIDNNLTECVRGQSGTVQKAWDAGTEIYHAWTADIANNIMENIENMNEAEISWDDIADKPIEFPPSPHTHTGDDVSIEPPDGMISENVQDGMQELFTFADNGRRGVVGWVQDGAQYTDTWDEIHGKLDDVQNELVAQLSAKGVVASVDDAPRLNAAKIATIPSGGGADWNIFSQTTQPDATDGLWIKRDDVENVQITELVRNDGSIYRMNATLAVAGARLNRVAPVENNFYIFGGTSVGANTIQKYDSVLDIRTTVSATLRAAIFLSAVAPIGVICYSFGGTVSAATNYIDAYDTITNIRTAKTNLPIATAGMTATPFNTIIYLFGGQATAVVATIKAYDTELDVTSTLGATLAETAYLLSSARIGTIIYIVGGYPASNKIQAFDTTTALMTTLSATLPTTALRAGSSAVGNILYVFFNYNIYAYDTETGLVTTIAAPEMAFTREMGVAESNGICHLFGGYANIDEIQAFYASTHQFPTGTAVVNLDPGGLGKATLYEDDMIMLRPRIRNVSMQEDTGLHLTSAATNDGSGVWKDII